LARGWPVVSIDYRLLPQVNGEAIRQDIISAWRFIVDELPTKLPAFKIDPLRLTAAGQSAGGYLAYLAGAHCHPRPAAVFSIYGISTFNDRFFFEKIQLNKYPLKRANLAHYLDSPSVIAGDDSVFVAPSDAPDAADLSGLDRLRTKLDRPALYDYFVQEGLLPAAVGNSRELDPLQLLDASFPPTITLHGTGDRLVPHYMSRKVVEKLKAFGVEAHQFEVEGVDHGFEVFSHAYDRPGSKIWSTYLEKPFLALDRIYGR
jgi:acetyl esterase/lipase